MAQVRWRLTVTPTCRHGYTKIGILEVADGTTGVLAFKLPKYAVVMGVYTICNGANTTQTINLVLLMVVLSQ